jgi:hypothetical protein
LRDEERLLRIKQEQQINTYLNKELAEIEQLEQKQQREKEETLAQHN